MNKRLDRPSKLYKLSTCAESKTSKDISSPQIVKILFEIISRRRSFFVPPVSGRSSWPLRRASTNKSPTLEFLGQNKNWIWSLKKNKWFWDTKKAKILACKILKAYFIISILCQYTIHAKNICSATKVRVKMR